ncbi:hypothetical protein [Rhizobium anhuiense]|uniref:hypothetical protein n=1 Tax=Rhizobium anhuiense TaxID=1184720 RepID=UPI0015CF3668|nr:hypothetical protein [Rhizobium anhuiense]
MQGIESDYFRLKKNMPKIGAGYSFVEELPIMVVVFSPPAVVAIAAWLLARG